jgi:mono/diheme cytochrome c family protein
MTNAKTTVFLHLSFCILHLGTIRLSNTRDMNQHTITILSFMAGAIGASIVGGIVLSGLVWLITKFFRSSVPSTKVMTEFNTAENARLVAERAKNEARPFSLSARAEPIAIAVGSFVAVALIVSILLPSLTAKALPAKADAAAEAKPAATGLATSGDFAKIIAELPAGNADNGKALYTSQACIGCHSLEAGKTLVGPSLAGVFTTAATREPGMGAKEYLYESIVNPNKFVVPNFQPNLMTQTFAKTLSPQQMADILAWMERDLK